MKATKYESKHLFSASNFMLWRLQWNRRCLKITRHLSENWKLLHLTQFNIEFWLEYFKLALTSCMRACSEIARNSQTFTSLTYDLRHLSSITQSGNIFARIDNLYCYAVISSYIHHPLLMNFLHTFSYHVSPLNSSVLFLFFMVKFLPGCDNVQFLVSWHNVILSQVKVFTRNSVKIIAGQN